MTLRKTGIALLTTSLSLFALAACTSADATSSSADELRDSFDRPTAHGELRFGSAMNNAAFTNDQRFHAWTFTLTDKANVDLKTVVSGNVDTVAFLYRRDAGSNGAWGPHVETNDDTNGTMASRIAKELGAGEYMLKVKPSKDAIRGDFKVGATCAGKGCPVALACDPSSFQDMPKATGYGASCQTKLDSVLASSLTSRGHADIVMQDLCSLQPIERAAFDYYHSYWSSMMGWTDFAGDEEELMISVERETRAAGTVVNVDIGGDETAMTFIFDNAGKLLFYYQHNQSPEWGWFCKDAAESTAKEPQESCISDALSNVDASGTRRFVCK